MKSPNFLLHRIKYRINMSGKEYVFNRQSTDKYGQPTDKMDVVCVVKCVYHEANGYIQVSASDATVIRSKKSPMLLCAYDDATKLRQGDLVEIEGCQYKICGILNIQNYSVAADISLEEVI